jgi:hypothetical protein
LRVTKGYAGLLKPPVHNFRIIASDHRERGRVALATISSARSSISLAIVLSPSPSSLASHWSVPLAVPWAGRVPAVVML